jgi:hypothetical protein
MGAEQCDDRIKEVAVICLMVLRCLCFVPIFDEPKHRCQRRNERGSACSYGDVFFPCNIGRFVALPITCLPAKGAIDNREPERKASSRGNNISYSIAMLGQIPVSYSNYPIA